MGIELHSLGSREGVRNNMNDDCSNGSNQVTYNPKTGIYAAAYGEEPPSVVIIEAITEITEKGVTELDSLHQATEMDIDALDDLFRATVAGVPRKEGRIEFEYEDFEVRVFSFGRIEIEPLDDDDQ